MPRFLEATAAAMPEGTSRHRPREADFSFVEQVWHLADLEREGFSLRIRRLLHESRPELPDFDGARIARERNYRALDLTEGLAAFSRERKANLASLAALAETERGRPGIQEGVGAITLGEIPQKMAEHDRSHRREVEQLVALITRAPRPDTRS